MIQRINDEKRNQASEQQGKPPQRKVESRLHADYTPESSEDFNVRIHQYKTKIEEQDEQLHELDTKVRRLSWEVRGLSCAFLIRQSE
jgi:hypothetical protein